CAPYWLLVVTPRRSTAVTVYACRLGRRSSHRAGVRPRFAVFIFWALLANVSRQLPTSAERRLPITDQRGVRSKSSSPIASDRALISTRLARHSPLAAEASGVRS